MVDTYLEPNGNPKHDRRIRKELGLKRHPFRAFLKVIFMVFFVSALLVGNVIIFHNLYFKSFFVNGQSMYPTLNGNATCASGVLISNEQKCGDNGTTVEYGIMDTHKSAIDSIRRFDIIVTAYDADDTKDKIKRVIAMPGETFYFVSTERDEATNGDLYVIPEGESEGVLIPQNFGDLSIIRHHDYSSSMIPKQASPLTLADNEYYVMGDNRPISSDSSSAGPILYEYIKGVAVAIEGTCTLVCNGAECRAENVRFHWPRSLRWQDE